MTKQGGVIGFYSTFRGQKGEGEADEFLRPFAEGTNTISIGTGSIITLFGNPNNSDSFTYELIGENVTIHNSVVSLFNTKKSQEMSDGSIHNTRISNLGTNTDISNSRIRASIMGEETS